MVDQAMTNNERVRRKTFLISRVHVSKCLCRLCVWELACVQSSVILKNLPSQRTLGAFPTPTSHSMNFAVCIFRDVFPMMHGWKVFTSSAALCFNFLQNAVHISTRHGLVSINLVLMMACDFKCHSYPAGRLFATMLLLRDLMRVGVTHSTQLDW